MKIVLALSYTPCPVTRGIDRLVVNLIRGLSERHEVALVTMVLENREIAAVRGLEGETVQVHPLLAPNKRSRVHRMLHKVKNHLTSLVTGIPVQVLYATPRPYIDRIVHTVHATGADLVLVSYWHHYNLPRRLEGVRCALVTYDIDYLVNRERLRYARGGLRRILASRAARMGERTEKEAYRSYETVLTVTDRDAESITALAADTTKTVRTLPLAIDLDSYRRDAFERDPHRILFLGALDADFNRDALHFFLEKVFPLVRARHRDACVDVVGGGADPGLLGYGGASVRFFGRVQDIRPYLGECSLMVLPLRFGGGVRIRMMEAAAMATPVVSTPVGVAGMGLTPGSEYLEAEEPRELAAAIARLIDDGDEASRIGMNARYWAERNFSMSSYADRLERLLDELVSSRSKSSI
ncbi:MAG: glycosyltransferase [bacterium]|nr:MAG: glycosyltransferase [bacterium]